VIRFHEVSLGQGAGSACSRCAVDQVETSFRPGESVVSEAAAVCASWTDGTGPNIRLTGAEPFAHPDLPAIVTGIMEAGCSRLAIDTDALGMRSPGNAHGVLAAGVRSVRFDLLAGTEGVHDALAGTPGMFEGTKDGIRSYRAAADAASVLVSVTARVQVCRHNLRDLPSAVGAAVEVGVDRVEIVVTDGGIDLAAALPWITASCDTGVVNGVWVEVEGVPFCLLPGYDLHLADAVRERGGAKQPACATCALDPVCGGAPEGASADMLSLLAPPPFAAVLAPRVLRSRVTEVR
jgi:hypothetical protein